MLSLGAVILGLVTRVAVSSPLWLDESISVAIADRGPGQLADTLRQDGAPALYYLLLWGWMQLFGDGDTAVRSLSLLASVVAVAITVDVVRRREGQRAAWFALAIGAALPWAVRYGSETRMYALVSALVAAGWWCLDRFIETRRPAPLVGVALIGGCLLHTHYWAMYLMAAIGIVVIVSWRIGELDTWAATRILGAQFVSGLIFLPWVGVLAYQSTHTGTPWASASHPTNVLAGFVADMGGGAASESVILGWIMAGLILIGLLARRREGPDGTELVLDGTAAIGLRAPVGVMACTLGIATLAGYASSSPFQARYAAVVVPMFVASVAAGLDRIPRKTGLVALTGMLALATIADVGLARMLRTDAEHVADEIAADMGENDLVVVCPDQLGPDLTRAADGRFEVLAVPGLLDATLVDWVDYAERNEAISPRREARAMMDRVQPDGAVWFVWWPDYKTYDGACEDTLVELAELSERDQRLEPTPGSGEPSFLERFSALDTPGQ